MEDIKFLLKMSVEQKFKPEDTHYLSMVEGKPELVDIFYKNKMGELDRQLRCDALQQVLKNKYIQYYNTLIETENVEELLPTLKKIKELRDKEDHLTNSDYLFITISPAEGEIKPLALLKLLDRFCKLKWVHQFVYVLEQRFNGIPNDKYKNIGDGLHAHILLNRNKYKMSHLKRDYARVFGCYTINTDFGFRHFKDIMKTQKYIIGLKDDEDKQIKQRYDAEFRQKEGIKNYYGSLWELV